MKKKIIISAILILSTLYAQIGPAVSSQIYRVGDIVSDFSGAVCSEVNQTISLYEYNGTENYGDYYDTKLGMLWHKRAYEFGIYYHPDNDAGGLYFRINGFEFGDSVKAVF